VEAAIISKGTRDMIIGKAFRDAKAIAISKDIYADLVMPQLLAKAHNQMLGVKSHVPG
jgi:hypothetical protein